MKRIIIFCLIFLGIGGFVFANERDLPGITIISRAERGANEAIRYSKMTYGERKERLALKNEEEMNRLEETDMDEFFIQQKQSYEKEMRNEYLIKNYSDEQKVDKIIYQIEKNNLLWPQAYHFQKNKIIIHHTAGDSSSFTGKEAIISYLKDIYIYHTITRGRGDIGYNFLIDPFGNIYEGRAGGDGVIGAHVKWNNTPSIGISLMGNFDIQKPTANQIKSLVNLIVALSQKYHIDPTAKTEYHKEISKYPYMKSQKAGVIAGHRDAGNTSCPGENLYSQIPLITKLVLQNLAKGTLISNTSSLPNEKKLVQKNQKKGLYMLKNWKPEYDKIVDAFQQQYMKKNTKVQPKIFTNKIIKKINKEEAKKYSKSDISVLLYELSTQFVNRDIACESVCTFTLEGSTIESNSATIEIAEGGLLLEVNNKKYYTPNIKIDTKIDQVIKITNYGRVSYYGIPWNTFYGSILFEKGKIKNLTTGKFDEQYLVINTLPFQKYLKGVVETNDSEHVEKIKAMNLITKGYALFYMNPINKHPSIPEDQKYTAIDSPEMFQKYVGAGLEKTLKIVPSLIEQQKSELIIYDDYLPILPYFNCSAGFTRSAKEKRGWLDTPYLLGRIDREKCEDFNGHGVGLSGRGAQYFAKQGWTYKEILGYYYPGITLIDY